MAHLQPVALEPQNQADEPSSPVERFGPGAPLLLDAGVALLFHALAASVAISKSHGGKVSRRAWASLISLTRIP